MNTAKINKLLKGFEYKKSLTYTYLKKHNDDGVIETINKSQALFILSIFDIDINKNYGSYETIIHNNVIYIDSINILITPSLSIEIIFEEDVTASDFFI